MGGSLQQVGLPLVSLIGMSIEALKQLSYPLIALNAAESAALALKADVCFQRGRLAMIGLPDYEYRHTGVRQSIDICDSSDSRGHFCDPAHRKLYFDSPWVDN